MQAEEGEKRVDLEETRLLDYLKRRAVNIASREVNCLIQHLLFPGSSLKFD